MCDCVSGFVAVVAAAFRFGETSKFANKWLVRAVFGLVLWYTIYQSGVHATVAGVILGILIPAVRAHTAINKVQPATNFFILPVFAFTAANFIRAFLLELQRT